MVIKVGVIGCGRIASLLENDALREHPCTHAGAYKQVQNLELAAACDINEERLKNFAEKWGVSQTYTDYRELLAQKYIEIVSVCTWHDSHAQIVTAAAKTPHIKGIICEKPIAVNLREGRKMVETALKNGVKLVVNHERRWQSNYRQVREMLQAGVIGPVRTVIGNILTGTPQPEGWPASLSQAGGGSLLHDGTHLIDIMRYLFGEVLWVHGWAERHNEQLVVEDTALAFIQFGNGVKAFVEGGGRRNYFNFELDIQGRDGRILIGNGLLKLWRRDTSRRYEGFYDLVEQPFPAFNYRNPYVLMVNELVSWCLGEAPACSTGADGLAALEVIMAIYYSAVKGGRKVEIPFNKSNYSKSIGVISDLGKSG